MALHKAIHPTPVEGCFGCKVLGLGFDGGHNTKTVRDEAGNDTTEHRSGRVDVTINAPTIHLSAGAMNTAFTE